MHEKSTVGTTAIGQERRTMREVHYKTHWSYRGAAVKRSAPLSEFLLDVLYLMETNGVLPPLQVLNEVFTQGGNNGGMGPGTSWRPFQIKEAEYNELVEALLNLDVAEAKKSHPYIYFQRVIVDDELNQRQTYLEWLQAVSRKYPQST